MALFNFVELKPCPFCGEKPEDWRTREAIVCMRCGYQLNRQSFNEEEDLGVIWNRRVKE